MLLPPLSPPSLSFSPFSPSLFWLHIKRGPCQFVCVHLSLIVSQIMQSISHTTHVCPSLPSSLAPLAFVFAPTHTHTRTYIRNHRFICLDAVQWSMKIFQNGVARALAESLPQSAGDGNSKQHIRTPGTRTHTHSHTHVSGSIHELIVCITQILLYL